MATLLQATTVYMWKENFMQGATWKKYRLSLYSDGSLIWDEPQTEKVKGKTLVNAIFRRIGIATLFHSHEQQKAASKSGLSFADYGLLLPFSRGESGLELSQFALTSTVDLQQWMLAIADRMNVTHMLVWIVENRPSRNDNRKAKKKNSASSIHADRFWEDAGSASDKMKAVVGETGAQKEKAMLLQGFELSDCAEMWRELQETYHVCTSAASRQMSAPAKAFDKTPSDDANKMHRTLSTRSLPTARGPRVTNDSMGV